MANLNYKIHDHQTEEALVSLLIRKDKKALERLYELYSGALYSIILAAVKKEDVADKALAYCFVKIWNRIGEYSVEKERLFTWMVRICKRHVQNLIHFYPYILSLSCNPSSNMPESVIVDDLKVTEVLPAREDLDDKRLLELIFFRGLSEDEICRFYDIDVEALRIRIRRVIKTFQVVEKEGC